MSEKIKITVVIDDEKQNTEIEEKSDESVIVTHDLSMTLMSTLLKNNLIEGSFCGGRGDCGRCVVQFLQGAPLPTPLERGRLEAQELRQGFRLACLAKPKDDCVIKIKIPSDNKISILAEMMDLSKKSDSIGQYQKPSIKRKLHVTECEGDGNARGAGNVYLVAVDLGTTTIAMQLRDIDTGDIVDTYCEMNPQRRYGSDVLSRIQASCEGHREALRQCVWKLLEQGVEQFAEFVETAAIKCICVAGNTTMEHLFMGHDVTSLGRRPFTPVEIGLQESVGPLGIPLYITPGISAFVGGDITAGMYALGMTEQQKSVRLLIDLGTNGEMAIVDGTRMFVTATAAGPAFEGGTGKTVVGTDMIAVTDFLRKQGILDAGGLLAEPYFTKGVTIHTLRGDFRLMNRDIRALQMAKAAVRAGVEILWEQMGRPQIGRVYLAGGFGYYLDVEAAFSIGLLPGQMRGRVQAVGNSALEGAFRIGRDLCKGVTDKRRLEAVFGAARSINLAKQKEFEKLYLGYLDLTEG